MNDKTKTLIKNAENSPCEVSSQIKAAYALDSIGDEVTAIKFYDRAYNIGVPKNILIEILLG